MGIESKSWLDISEGEEVLWWNHPHLLHYIPDILVGLVMMVGGVVFTFYSEIPIVDLKWYPLLISVFGLLFILLQFIERGNHYYVVTTQKIIEKRGIISEDRDPVHFNRIANTRMTRTVGERIISFIPGFSSIADISVETAGTSGSDMLLLDIPQANDVAHLIEDRMANNGGGPAAAGDFTGGGGQQGGYPNRGTQGGHQQRQQGNQNPQRQQQGRQGQQDHQGQQERGGRSQQDQHGHDGPRFGDGQN